MAVHRWFVRAERGEKSLDLPIADQRESDMFGKHIPFKSARDVAYATKENLMSQGWDNVRVVRVDS